MVVSLWRRFLDPLYANDNRSRFFWRHAKLARVLAMALCLCWSVCLSVSVSVTSRCYIETVERIRLVFGTRASFHLSYTVL